ncbi:hypothetical protein ABK040_014602 [Willaertia magna]
MLKSEIEEDEFQKFGIKEIIDDLQEELLRGIYYYGIEKLSPLQQKVIFQILYSSLPANVICVSLSGTGKTMSHIISMLQKISLIKEQQLENKYASTTPLGLIIVPTRELTYGICHVFKYLSKFMNHIKVHNCCGGKPFKEDILVISEGVDIIVGTPGRVLYLVKEGYLDLSQIKMLVFDQLDEIILKGFKEQMESICKDYIPKDVVQICVYSLQITNEMDEFLNYFVRDPIRIIL